MKPSSACTRAVRRPPLCLATAAIVCLTAAGCMGSWALRGTRLHHIESFAHTSSQEMLLTIVRMRYGETPSFLDLPVINSVTEARLNGTGAQPADSPLQGLFGGTFGLRDEPTLSYQPRGGDNLAESMIQAYPAELLLDMSPGNDRRTFLLAFVDSINGVRNAPTATSPASRILEPNETGAADVRELERVFGLERGRSIYSLQSETNDEIDLNTGSTIGPEQGMTDTMAIRVRSGYQVLAFLSKGVDVPDAHVRRCSVECFRGPDGRPFDGRQLTRGLFHVCVQKHRPLRSDLAVHYRGHWFSIPEDDVPSRATLNLLKLAIDLQSEAANSGPVLTLPLN